MEFIIYRTSDNKRQPTERAYKKAIEGPFGGDMSWVVNIKTLQDLVELQQEIDEEIIINGRSEDSLPTIEIYDHYRE